MNVFDRTQRESDCVISAPRSGRQRVLNPLTFDLEHWYSATLVNEDVSDPADRVRESVGRVLRLLRKHGVEATFFVVGEIAAEYPSLVRRVADEGHEIASHGYTHRPVFELDRSTFRRELEASTESIREATNERPRGFRAPNFSITPRTQWALGELRSMGYGYDSSVFPVRTPLYGVSGAPIRPYRVDERRPFDADACTPGRSPDLFEFPAAVFGPRLRIPVSGGFYARLLPDWALTYGIRSLNRRGIPATVYFHSWEFNPVDPIPDLAVHKRFVTFHGTDTIAETLETLLERFEFDTIQRVIDTYVQ